jgi:hypothetical protein
MVKRKINSSHDDEISNTKLTKTNIKNDIYSRASVTTTQGRGSLSGWTSCPLCCCCYNHHTTTQKKYALGRGITMHLEQVHTPWRPGKAEIVRRERLRKRIQTYVHWTFAEKNDRGAAVGGDGGGSRGISQVVASKDDILANVPPVKSMETQEEYRDRLLKHYLGENVWDRDGKARSIVYDPTKDEEVQWSHKLLELAQEVEENYVNKGHSSMLNTNDDKNDSTTKLETEIIEAGHDRNGKKSQSYKESLPPFIKAASDGNIKLLQTMVEHAKGKSSSLTCQKDPVEELLDTRDRNGSTAEHWAAGNGHLDCLKYLFCLSAKYTCKTPNSTSSHNSTKRRRKRDGKTSLHYAARNGHTHIVQYLLDDCTTDNQSCPRHQDVNVESGDGTTPLHLACYGGHLETIQYLIEQQKADLYKTNEWNCGIGHWIAMSIQQDDKELVSILNYIKTLVKGESLFDIFARAQKQGHTSVHKAAQKLNKTFIEWLACQVKNDNWTVEQREEAGRRDDGGHKPSDIWLKMGGSEEFHNWMKDECGW